MSSDSIKILAFIFLLSLTIFNYVFSPTIAETVVIDEKNSFLNSQKGKEIRVFTITGYSSSSDETDDTPWITAYNSVPRWGTVASNVLPFGTKIKIPSLFGDQIFVVEDKMNPRFNENIDIWFPSKLEAKEFGIHPDVLVEILP